MKENLLLGSAKPPPRFYVQLGTTRSTLNEK